MAAPISRVLAFAALFAIGASVTPARTQTVINVSDAAGLVSALNTVSTNPGTSYLVNLTQNITLTASTTLPAINSASSVTIDGHGNTLDGGGVQRGFFAFAGTIAVQNMTIQNTVALGGSGANGGGGGAGLGGALFVASGATVTASNLSLGSNTAAG